MTVSTKIHPVEVIHYPDSDGKPMAENTLQYQWIVMVKENVEAIFEGDPHIFVAADNLIYALEGRPKEVKAPDVYVAFGRPKGHRGSYKVWKEGNIFPQVVFEILSPGNSGREMVDKRMFYERHGAEEFYMIDPEYSTLEVWLRKGDRLVSQHVPKDFTSPRLGVRFRTDADELMLFGPDGERFLTVPEIRKRADREQSRADREQSRADRLAAKLRALGIDPDAA